MSLFIKRIFDITVSIIVLIVISPALILLIVLIFIFSGRPIIFKQKRLGLNGTPFFIYKFRTMYNNNIETRNSDGSVKIADSDSRITPIGKILRNTSIDELPQLINVLLGQMSIVGPRPDQYDQLVYYTDGDRIKLGMKPGITGLAQINGRNSISWQTRKEYDIEYVNKYSLYLDMVIILRTIPIILNRDNVYSL